jgi:aspartate/methionine/tyrosine aminotransferase
VLSPSVLREIAQIARARDLWVLADEIYAEIMYEGSHHSIMREDGMAERTILLDGFSKTFAMTGWRLGYGVFPWPLVEPVTKLVTNSVSCTATFTQRAGAAALNSRPPEVADMVKAFRERRDAMVTGLNKIDGISCREPKGAFYVFPNITGLGLGDSVTVQERILREAGVAALSGTAFGAGGEGYLRLSYANSLKNLQAAVTRIGEWAHAARQGRLAAAAGSVTSSDRQG